MHLFSGSSSGRCLVVAVMVLGVLLRGLLLRLLLVVVCKTCADKGELLDSLGGCHEPPPGMVQSTHRVSQQVATGAPAVL